MEVFRPVKKYFYKRKKERPLPALEAAWVRTTPLLVCILRRRGIAVAIRCFRGVHSLCHSLHATSIRCGGGAKHSRRLLVVSVIISCIAIATTAVKVCNGRCRRTCGPSRAAHPITAATISRARLRRVRLVLVRQRWCSHVARPTVA